MGGGPGQPMPLAHPASMPSGDDDDDADDEEDDQAPAPEGWGSAVGGKIK